MIHKLLVSLFSLIVALSCSARQPLLLGDQQPEKYLPLLEGKRVALFSNQTGLVNPEKHILDCLIEQKVNVTGIFSPEHGFRGTADAGEKVADGKDDVTGIAIHSLYGASKHPSAQVLDTFDVLVVDIQDVGLRFYTYYVTMLDLMRDCAAAGKPVVILDRPNPNGHYVDGPILDMSLKSGVGALPIPVVHGLTLGELALMAKGEGWLPTNCEFTVIPCKNYTHATPYELPVAPSPNLPNMQSIYLYPALCPFEGTVVSLGRGTDKPFQQYGHPAMTNEYTFTPQSVPGAMNPPLLGQLCHGVDLSSLPDAQHVGLDLSYVMDAYTQLVAAGLVEGKPGAKADAKPFFRRFFDLLLGQTWVREMIEAGASADEIRTRWAPDVEAFLIQRQPYLLYPLE